mgnify:CR=1 FL=1
MFRSISLAILAILSFLIPSLASAQGNLGSHYREVSVLLTAAVGQAETHFMAIPRQGWPVHVQVSGVDPSTGSVQASTSFVIVDGNVGNPKMTIPSSTALTEASVACVDNGPDAVVDCTFSGSLASVGYTDTGTSNQPHRMFVKLKDCGCALQFRITMWY